MFRFHSEEICCYYLSLYSSTLICGRVTNGLAIQIFIGGEMDLRVFFKVTNDHGLQCCLWESSIIEFKMLLGCVTKESGYFTF